MLKFISSVCVIGKSNVLNEIWHSKLLFIIANVSGQVHGREFY